MSNMSYCRFQNTRNDLSDCADVIEALANCDTQENPLSDDELRAAVELVEMCVSIINNFAEAAGIDVDTGDFDRTGVIRRELTKLNEQLFAAIERIDDEQREGNA